MTISVPDISGIKIHPFVTRKYTSTSKKHPHFEGGEADLAQVVIEALKDEGNVEPGRFPDTYVLSVNPDRFCTPAIHTAADFVKPAARVAKVVVWQSAALERSGDPLASKCSLAIVKLAAV